MRQQQQRKPTGTTSRARARGAELSQSTAVAVVKRNPSRPKFGIDTKRSPQGSQKTLMPAPASTVQQYLVNRPAPSGSKSP